MVVNHSELVKRRSNRLIEAGICIDCSKFLAEKPSKRCRNCLDKRKIKQHKYYLEHKKKIQAGQKRSIQKNRQKYLDIKKRHYQSHKDKSLQYAHEYRARKLGVGGKYTQKEWKELLNYCGNKCLKCGATTRLEADHVIPISIGGDNSIDNIQPLCRYCNAQKHVDIIDYRPYIDWT